MRIASFARTESSAAITYTLIFVEHQGKPLDTRWFIFTYYERVERCDVPSTTREYAMKPRKNKLAYPVENKYNFVLRSTGLWHSVNLRVPAKRSQVPERLHGTYLAAHIT